MLNLPKKRRNLNVKLRTNSVLNVLMMELAKLASKTSSHTKVCVDLYACLEEVSVKHVMETLHVQNVILISY
jgi:hypothetical protein